MDKKSWDSAEQDKSRKVQHHKGEYGKMGVGNGSKRYLIGKASKRIANKAFLNKELSRANQHKISQVKSYSSEWGGTSTTLCSTFYQFSNGQNASTTINLGTNSTDFTITMKLWIYASNGVSDKLYMNFNNQYFTYDISSTGATACGAAGGWYYFTVTSYLQRFECNIQYLIISFLGSNFYGIESVTFTHSNGCSASSGCKCCQVANRTHCTQCWDTKFYLDTLINGCYPCDLTCRSCAQSSLQVCSSCWGQYLWYMGGSDVRCTNTCPTNSYLYSGTAPYCVNCTDPNCATCAPESICTRCNDKYYLTTSTCTACDSSCATCSGSASTCTSCPSGQVLKSSACVSSCGTNFRNNSNVCQACIQPICEECTAAAGTCSKCPTGYYIDSAGVCQACVANCLNCTSTTCNYCDYTNNWYWDPVNLVCANTCPTYYRENMATGICERCTDTHCKTCAAAGTTCTDCDTTYFVTPSFACASCIANCDTCSDSNRCTTCTSGFSLQSGTTTDSCTGVCQSGYMSLLGVCVPCSDANCVSCPASQSICTACASNYYFLDTTFCTHCMANCQLCTSASTCSYCDSTYFYDTLSNTCGTTCPSYYREESSSRLCEACSDPNCLTCPASSSTCTSCAVTYYVDGSNACSACSSNCDYCNSTGCNTCTSGYYLMPDLTCITPCPTGYMTNVSNCVRCDDLNCLDCPTNKSICSVCPVDYYYVDSTSRCSTCMTGCLNCVDDLTCSYCDVGYFYLSPPNQCTTTCPTGYYTNWATRTCDPCAATNCTSCPLSSAICVECAQLTHYLTSGLTCQKCSGACLQCTQTGYCLQCDVGYYIGSTGSCLSCPSNCLYCSDGATCTTCVADYYLFQGNSTCISACNSPLWKNDQDRTCAVCTASNCISCPINPAVCIECNKLTYLNGSTCINCPSRCLSCSSPSVCYDCQAGYFLYNNTCQTSCPAGTAPNVVRHCLADVADSYSSGNASKKAVVAADVCTGILVGTGLPSAALGLSGPTMWSAFGALQTIGMFNTFDVVLPANARVFLGGLTTSHFSFLTSSVASKPDSLTTTRSLAETTTTADVGLDRPAVYSDKSIFSTKGLPLLIVIVVFYGLSTALVFLSWCDAFVTLKKAMQWNGVMRVSILCYLPLCTYSFIQIANGASTTQESTSMILAFVGLIYCLSFLIWVGKILKKDIPTLYKKETEDMYGTLYSNNEAHNNKFAKYYTLILLFRSTFQAMMAAFMKSAASVQLVFLMIIDLVLLYKMVAERVFTKKTDRQLLVLQQGCILFSEICMLIFSSVNLSYSAGNVIGWAFIVVVMMTLIINMIRVLYMLFICIFKVQSPKQKLNRVNRIKIVPFEIDQRNSNAKILSRNNSYRSDIPA